ncbi:MAG: dipeptidase, partial [Actinomycetota bacterium]|nr:dipeptidase [Actinomycetota bacterium]
GLCYNQRNFVGDGCSERTDAGLSDFGIAVVKELNRQGIVIDLSHTGYTTTMEAIEFSERPPVFSHANVRSLCESRRNVKDDQILAVARKGGLVGINAFPAFLRRGSIPTLNDFLDHVDYVAHLVGPEHVALGLDFSGPGSPSAYANSVRALRWKPDDYPPPPYIYPAGLEDPSKLPYVTAGLLQRSYSQDEVRMILGGNWVRVFRAVWQV